MLRRPHKNCLMVIFVIESSDFLSLTLNCLLARVPGVDSFIVCEHVLPAIFRRNEKLLVLLSSPIKV